MGAFLASAVGDLDEADELLQRVAMAVVRKYEQYDGSRPFTAWAIGIARYELLAHRRSQATERHVFDDELLGQLADRHQALAGQTGEARSVLRRCLEELPQRSRQALHLRYAENLKPGRIADRLGAKPGATRMLLMRARRLLRQCVERGLGQPERAT